jgi:hypothetical protein
MHASVDFAHRNGLEGFRNLGVSQLELNYEKKKGRYDTAKNRTSHEFT